MDEESAPVKNRATTNNDGSGRGNNMAVTSSASRTGGGGNCSLGFFVHVLLGRWFSLYASCVLMAGAGATYLFGVYSKEIKHTLGYDQTTLNLLGSFKDFGANVGVLSGLIAEVTPVWLVLLLGAGLNFAGYFMIWLAVTERIAKPKVWQMAAYIWVGANSQNFVNTGALVTSIRNFPENRGILIGLLKGYTGLSGAIFTQIYLAVYGNDAKSLILLIAWLPAALAVFFVYSVREMKAVSQGKHELKIFYQFLYVTIALALFIMVMTVLEKLVAFSTAAYAGSVAVCCALLLIPLIISIHEESDVYKLKKALDDDPKTIVIENSSSMGSQAVPATQLSSTKKEEKPPTLWYKDIFKKPERGDDYTILQALLSIDMLLIFIAAFCGLGSSLTAVDNLGQIGESLGYPQKTIKTFISLVSIYNFFGRIFAGFVSETLLAKYKFPRTLVLALNLCLSCIGLLLIAFPVPGSVYVASVIIGFSFGAQTPLLYTIVSEVFGLLHYGTLFNAAQATSPLGSYVLNVLITGALYDKEALRQLRKKGMDRSSVKELICIGSRCYRTGFIILAGVTLGGALCTFILVARTREFYRGDIYQKFRAAEPSVTEMVSSAGTEKHLKEEI